MPRDPFAVSKFEDLPAARELARPDFDLGKFGPVWVQHLGGLPVAERFVRDSFGGLRGERHVGVLVSPVEVIPMTYAAVDRAAWLERGLALLTVLEQSADTVPLDVALHVLPSALDVHPQWEARRGAARRDWMQYHLENAPVGEIDTEHGPTRLQRVKAKRKILPTEAVGFSRSVNYASNGKAWAERDLPSIKAIAARRAQGGAWHAADAWFAQGHEGHVAASLMDSALRAVRAGRRPASRLRWDLLNLCEGYCWRKLPLPAAAYWALAASMGLLDSQGQPREDLALGGVEARTEFILVARARSEHPDAKAAELSFAVAGAVPNPSDLPTIRRWMKTALFASAVKAFQATHA
ncbi:MAG: hypothetical protein ABL879_06220 [Devosia sp.]